MPVAEQNAQYRSEGYGTAQPTNDAQQATGGAPQAQPAQPLQAAPHAPPPQVQGDLPAPEKPQQNLVQLNDGTVLNMDQALFAPTHRPGEPVTTAIGQGGQPSLSQLFDAMATTSPAADIAGMAALAKKLGL